MSLTWAADERLSILMGKMCSLLPVDRRIHKTECFMFRCFFLNHLPPNIRTHLMVVNFYRKFILGAALLLRPLTKALQGDSVLSSAKSALALVPALVHPYSSAKISLVVDASDSHVGAVFQQLVQGSWAPLAFFSRKLSSAESCYSAFDHELLPAYSVVRHFRFLLEGRDFTLFTNPKPLTHSLFRVSLPGSPGSNGSYPTSLSSPATSSTSLALRMLWQMLSPGPLHHLL